MAVKTVQVTSVVRKPAGSLINPVAAALHLALAADGDNYEVAGNDGKVWLSVENTNGAARILVVKTPVTEDELALADREISIPANARRLIGPLPPATYGETLEVEPKTSAQFGDFKLAAFRLGA